MREEAFRTFLAPMLSARSVGSYLSYARRAERDLGVDLDRCALDDEAVAGMAESLRARGVDAKSIQNLASALRRYGHMRAGLPVASARARRVPVQCSLPAQLADASDLELLQLYGDIIEELRLRGVVRTGNGPVGDYAELLFARAFGWKLAGNSASGYDAIKDGIRYQIKARRIGPRNPSRQLSAIRKLPDRTFDTLAACLFDEDFRVTRAVLIPHATVTLLARRSDHTNSWRLMLSDAVCARPDVTDVTAALRAI